MIFAEILQPYDGNFKIYFNGKKVFSGDFDDFCNEFSLVQTVQLGKMEIDYLTCEDDFLLIHLV